jgi:hypothetical protein
MHLQRSTDMRKRIRLRIEKQSLSKIDMMLDTQFRKIDHKNSSHSQSRKNLGADNKITESYNHY